MINKIIKRIKGSDYSIDRNITFFAKISILFERFFMLLRGNLFRLFKTNSNGLLFISKNVKVKFGKKITFGKNCTIHRNCYINGLVKEKILIGNNFTLGMNSIIEGFGILSNLGDSLKIGNNVGISPNALLSIRGSIVIGDDTIIGPYFSIHPENHSFNDNNSLIRMQGVTRQGVVIGKNCWIGAKVTILDGVSIGNNCVVAAGAVITKSFSENSIIGGVPARIISNRMGGNDENINDK